jgi:hypothetical protein
LSTIGSIVLRADPVKRWEHYSRTLAPVGDVGLCELYFEDYRPTLQAQGWFQGASFRVLGRENLLKELYANALGRMAEAWGYGLKQYFEGRVVEVTFNLPPDRFTKSLNDLANKSWMRADYDGDGTVDRTTVLQNLDSQSKYGIVDTILAGGEVEGLNVGDQAVQALIDLSAFPKPAADLGGGAGQPYIELFCRGFIHTLSNQVYNQTADTGTQSMSAQIKDIVDAKGEFIASLDRGPNTTSVTKELDSDRKARDLIDDMAALGDADNNRWLVQGRGRTATSVKGRRLVFKQAAPVVVPPTI